MHIPVLLAEVLAGLALEPDDVVLDATAGGGGHSQALCRALGPKGVLIALDADSSAVERVRSGLSALGSDCRYTVLQSNFRHLDRALKDAGIQRITKALFDLGLSSDQLDFSGRGFSFRLDEPLLMTFPAEPPREDTLTARVILNEWDEGSIADVLYYYGDERHARSIAKEIVRTRRVRPFVTTNDLVEVVARVMPKGSGRLHPATKTFQALRITVNDEIGALREGLAAAYEHLSPEGRIAVISFHSMEDRIVKRFMASRVEEDKARLVVKKPITPSEEECRTNPRARSAKLRILAKH